MPIFTWGNRGQRESGVAASHSREGALLGARTQGASQVWAGSTGSCWQAELVVWETVLTAKTSLQTLRASDHLGIGTRLSGFRC